MTVDESTSSVEKDTPEQAATVEPTETVAPVEEVDAAAESSETDTAEKDSAPEAQASVEELTKALAAAQKQAQDNWEALLRQKAESDNLQKRSDREVEKARKFALEKFVNELLPIVDSMELGLEAAQKDDADVQGIREGIDLTTKMLLTAIEKFNVEAINPQDEQFDPQWHEAMAMQPVPNVEEGTVIFVHQKGYKLNDRLLRPARVVVAKALD